MTTQILPGYLIRSGSTLDRALLVKFMRLTYQDMFPQQDFSHLTQTVGQYLSSQTPLWWVDFVEQGENNTSKQECSPLIPYSPIGCLWMGNAVDQVSGSRHAHIFLVYVTPQHRRRGVGRALMRYAQDWAKNRGDRQIGLQVFPANTGALNLYHHLGYQTQSLWMIKSLHIEN